MTVAQPGAALVVRNVEVVHHDVVLVLKGVSLTVPEARTATSRSSTWASAPARTPSRRATAT